MLNHDYLEADIKAKLKKNLTFIHEKIFNALDRCGDQGREVILVAVSKKQPVQKIKAMAELDQFDFGENYVQEGLEKIRNIGDSRLKWHFIGGLQSNKAKYIPGMFSLVHSLDSYKTAQALHKKAGSMGLNQPVLIQVNLAGEIQKSGVIEEELPGLAEKILALENLKLRGLMLMPPFTREPEDSRPYFSRLRNIKEHLEQRLQIRLDYLSMGMSQDFIQAVEEGANLLRIGSLLLGPRPGCTLKLSSAANI